MLMAVVAIQRASIEDESSSRYIHGCERFPRSATLKMELVPNTRQTQCSKKPPEVHLFGLPCKPAKEDWDRELATQERKKEEDVGCVKAL